jgi:hypothetical protein
MTTLILAAIFSLFQEQPNQASQQQKRIAAVESTVTSQARLDPLLSSNAFNEFRITSFLLGPAKARATV